MAKYRHFTDEEGDRLKAMSPKDQAAAKLKATSVNQKLLGRKYKKLKGKELECFIGRVPSIFKSIKLEISTETKHNEYGVFKPIKAFISSTHFNGSFLHLKLEYQGHRYFVNIPENEIDNLTIHMP